MGALVNLLSGGSYGTSFDPGEVAAEHRPVGPKESDIDRSVVVAADPAFDQIFGDGMQHPGTSGKSFADLERMSGHTVIHAAIGSLVREMSDWTERSRSGKSLGWAIRPRDPHMDVGPAELVEIEQVSAIVERAGGQFQRGGFRAFVQQLMWNSLVNDWAPIEKIFTRGGDLWGFKAMDAPWVRWRKPSASEKESGRFDYTNRGLVEIERTGPSVDRPEARSVDSGAYTVSNEWEPGEFAVHIRRPRTSKYAYGYGWPELDVIIVYLTYLINAESYNASNFVNGINTRNFITMKSAASRGKVNSFRREIESMLSGNRNSKRVPIFRMNPNDAEDISVHQLGVTSDMEFEKWLGWLLKLVCAIFGIDPSSLNFVYGNEGQSASMNSTNVGDRNAKSSERGTRPLLKQLSQTIDEQIIQQHFPKYRFEFVGFDIMDPKVEAEIRESRASTHATVNELRKEAGMYPFPPERGDVIAGNGSWMQLHMQLLQQEGEVDDGLDGYDFEELVG